MGFYVIEHMHIWKGLASCIMLEISINIVNLLSFDSVYDTRKIIVLFGEKFKLEQLIKALTNNAVFLYDMDEVKA